MSSDSHKYVQSEDVDGIRIILVVGHQLGPETAEQLDVLVDPLATPPGPRLVVLNLANLEAIQRAEIAILVRFQKRVKEAGGRLKLCRVRPQVLRLLALAHSDKLFDIHERQRDAVAAFLGSPSSSPARSKAWGSLISRRRLLIGAGVAVGAPLAASVWGYDPDWLTVIRHRIAVPGLDKPTIAAQISDLHADRSDSCSQLLRDRVAEQVRLESPDLIFATGDYITTPGDSIEDAASWLAALPSAEGIYAVMGNHDTPAVKEAIAAKGVTVLENSWTTVRGMVVAGVGDLSRWPHEPQKVLAAAPRKVGTILLAHQPDTFWAYDEPVTLQVSGHTHGGQATLFGTISLARIMPKLHKVLMRIPDLEPIAELKFMETRHGAWSGFFRRPDGSTLYVNRGLGHFKRISFYCPPELTVWTLVPA